MSGGLPAAGLQPHPAAGGAQVQQTQAALWWPAADPAKLRSAAAAWCSLATEVESVSGAASAVIGGVAAQNQGQAIEAPEAYWRRRWAGGSGALPAVAEGARALADGLERYASAVEQARARLQELIAAAATAVIIGVALTVLTVGISDVAAGAVAGSLVAAAAAVGIELSTEIAAIIATGLVFTGMGALEGGLSDLAIQEERVGYFHDQASINWNEVLQYTAVGAATAGVTFGAGTAVESAVPALGRISARLAGTALETMVGREASVGAGLIGSTLKRSASYRVGKPIEPETGLEWALTSPEQRAARVVEKYGINLRASGHDISIQFDANLGPGRFGHIFADDPTTIHFGREALSSEAELARTIAHELRHARAYLGSGANTEEAARGAEDALLDYVMGRR
ncbi:MAG: hypothetical protein JF924_04675 [Candidatus Dormibacteraeota bacterium]|nr:hypothetical protein [Candidatus Dormibacteraeota bacterium]